MTEAWKKWEGQVVNGNFPLRQHLGGSDNSVVFLTEHKAKQIPNAAIKLVPEDPSTAETQLSRWRTAASLSHPHLMRLLEVGRCHLGGRSFLFVVMEYAEENLAQILPQRALTPAEAREMLEPTLEALAYLHGKNLVQGSLKPSNLLVVNDQLKLAADTVRPSGKSIDSKVKPGIYDPPEPKNGTSSSAGDVWALGMTLVEALTQRTPEWQDSQSEVPSLPTSLPVMFANLVRHCLYRDPQKRATVADLLVQIKQPSPAPPAQTGVVAAEPPRKQGWLVAAVVAVLILAAIWAGSRLFSGHSGTARVAPTNPASSSSASSTSTQGTSPQSSAARNQEQKTAENPPAAVEEKPAEEPASKPVSPAPSDQASKRTSHYVSAEVVHEEIPDVPRSARNTIHGRIRVSVRVEADASGNVVDQSLENAGPSQYFASLALEAAKKWKFAPADAQDAREWIVRFEFTRGGTSAHATGKQS